MFNVTFGLNEAADVHQSAMVGQARNSAARVTGLGTARNERRATLRIRVVVFLVYPISHLMLALTRSGRT